jgi:hypothetical protein
MKAVVLALCSALLAPYQCATAEYQPLEDTAPKSLWLLAERFEKEGQTSAREVTLKQIIDQYPGSRYARRARAQLGIADPLDDEIALPPTTEEGNEADESAVNLAADAGL